MARLGIVAALGILTLVGGCDGNSENTGKSPEQGIGTGGVGSGAVAGAGGNSIAGTTARDSGVQTSGGSVAATGTTGSVGGLAGKGVGGLTTAGGSASSAGETGVHQVGGVPGAGGIGGTGTCNYPVCLYNLFSACPAAPPSSSCTTQETTNATTSQTNACYGDGSAVTSVIDLATYASKMTFKKGGTTCYTMETSVEMSGFVPTSTSTTLRNGLGNVVATETWDVASDTTTVTCTGAQPVVLNAACDATSDGTYNCQPGVCSP